MADKRQSGSDVRLPEGGKGERIRERLAERVMDLFRQARDYRGRCQVMGASVESWLGRLERAYHKVHEPVELAERPGMGTYYGLIAQKVNMTAAFLRSKYVAFGQYPFVLEPTPVVELPADKQAQGLQIVRGKLLSQLMSAGGIPAEALVRDGLLLPGVAKFVEQEARAAKALLRDEEGKLARQAAKNMTVLIQDQLAEGGFESAMSELVFYLSLYPAAFLSLEYEAAEDYRWEKNKLCKRTVVRPCFRAVNPRDAYPAPDSASAGDGAGFVEVLTRTRVQLASFLGNADLGYRDEAIRDVLDNGGGDWLGLADGGFLQDSDAVRILRCQMLVSGADLAEYGVALKGGDTAHRYYNADIEVCCGRVLRVVLVQSPFGRRTYFSASYKKIGRSAWGISPAMMIYDRQLSVNRVHYAMSLNLHYSAGAMVEINAGRFDRPEEVALKPFTRVFTAPDSQQTGGGIAMHQMRATFPALFNQLVNEIRLADDECGLPSFLGGNAGLQGAGRTLGGLALMQDNAVLGLKDCVAVVDMQIIRPAVTLLRDMNLEDSDDASIKGDSEVAATGLLGLERDLEKAKIMSGAAPNMAAWAQQGVIPQEMYRDYVRDLLNAQGFDTDRYLPAESMSGALGNMAAGRIPDQTEGLDGRSMKMMGGLQ